jgi:hypothetical protein
MGQDYRYRTAAQLARTGQLGQGRRDRKAQNNSPCSTYNAINTTLLNGQSHFTLARIGGADANMSYDVIFNSDFYIEWDVHSHRRILCLVVKYNLDRD